MKGEPEPVGDVVREWARRRGLEVVIELGIGDDAKWAELVGEDLGAIGRPVFWEGGVLHMLARDSHSAARLRYSVEAIRAVCNERLGEQLVRAIVVREPRRGSGSRPMTW